MMPQPATHAEFARHLFPFCSLLVREPWPSRIEALRPFVQWVVRPAADEDRPAIRAMFRDAMRRARGAHRLTSILKRDRCDVCGWKLSASELRTCRVCRRRLEQLEGADPQQEVFAFFERRRFT